MPVGPHILWPLAARKSTPSAPTSNGAWGADWQDVVRVRYGYTANDRDLGGAGFIELAGALFQGGLEKMVLSANSTPGLPDAWTDDSAGHPVHLVEGSPVNFVSGGPDPWKLCCADECGGNTHKVCDWRLWVINADGTIPQLQLRNEMRVSLFDLSLPVVSRYHKRHYSQQGLAGNLPAFGGVLLTTKS